MVKSDKYPDPRSPEGKERRKACEAAYARLISCVDEMVALGFQWRKLKRQLSAHCSRCKRSAQSPQHDAGVRALSGETIS